VTNKRHPKLWQQGDVLFKIAELPKGESVEEINDGIVARGEATGHAHRVRMAPPIKLFIIKAALYLVALDTAVIDHEEHKKIELPPGTYLISHVREYDHFTEEARNVTD
jgi:hypothetical protein